MQEIYTSAQAQNSSFEVSKVLRNTYALLAMTLAFSAITAYLAMAFNMPYLGLWNLIPFFGLLWMVEKNKNNGSGIFWTFAFTGWMGASIGPVIAAFLAVRGMEPILLSLGGTAAIFFAMSAYVLITKKDMSFMTGFLMTGILIAFIAGIANFFLQIQGLALAVSCMFLLLSSGMIMWQTSNIIHGGETNYISATVTLYVSLYNIFVSLLSITGIMGDD
ncbi:Bax inhibitor-1/YccA family protein [Pseudoteredinibacter isoporae]|uniref:Modulator of FtsH protease n=1 Tax=Pseudoteredinibacter isoporae TaxID=570281 RepID=A0A7X0MWA5_9GAMM|nr:Bax inhibitor-1/YccA family protein [Pseudoteredinibacter isoporae]MBB6521970.1 modulator of FtsH protease [Pseudoteredinibacter isoporae]NHO87506.1 Bax inhibitor-1/YccA family protein [Pseudoteredinibacter isoporae]NIB24163.1 Bax inhibitor-1/YccA family protein [Pseudoteredinibacter isoporae]